MIQATWGSGPPRRKEQHMRNRVALVLVLAFLALTAEAMMQTPWAQQRQQQAAPAPAAPDSGGMQSGMCPMMGA